MLGQLGQGGHELIKILGEGKYSRVEILKINPFLFNIRNSCSSLNPQDWIS